MSGMNIIVATGNQDKFVEIAKALSEIGIKANQVDVNVEDELDSIEDSVPI